jgi:hypothetical protein
MFIITGNWRKLELRLCTVFRERSVHPWWQQLQRPHNAGLIRAEMVESSYIRVIDSSNLLSLPSLNHSSGIKNYGDCRLTILLHVSAFRKSTVQKNK